jgi:hypothetical protein
MTGYAAEASIGERIKAARRIRGFRTTRELADAMPGSNLSEFVLENIEAGRKSDLKLSELLNIAKALRVPPPFLLAPLSDTQAAVDLPNLSEAVRAMSVAEFDAWVSGEASGSYRTSDPEERNDSAELAGFRELQRLRRELEREQIVGDLEGGKTGRLEYLERQTAELTEFLRSSGWRI